MSTNALGINLGGIAYYTNNAPFLDIFKNVNNWATDTGHDTSLILDSNGWPTTVPVSGGSGYNSVHIGLSQAWPAPYYPIGTSGQYVVLYDGVGTITYGVDATLSSHGAGTASQFRDVINVTPSAGGIWIFISAASPGSYIKNIRVVQLEHEAAYLGGQIFHPNFTNAIAPFQCLRFMDWMCTVGSDQTTWALRPTATQAFYGSQGSTAAGGTTYANGPIPRGSPVEMMVALCNQLNIDGWFCMPQSCTDDYITGFATYLFNNLNPNLKAWIEFTNEYWNNQGGVIAALAAPGYTTFNQTFTGWISGTTLHVSSGSPTLASAAMSNGIVAVTGAGVTSGTIVNSGSGSTWTVSKSQTVGSSGSPVSLTFGPKDDFNSAANYFGLRNAQIANIFAGIYGGALSSRVVRVFGTQNQNNGVTDGALRASLWNTAINGLSGPPANYVDVICTAPYITASAIPTSWNTDPQAYNKFWQVMFNGGSIDGVSSGFSGNPSLIAAQITNCIQSDLNYLQSNFPSIGLVHYESGPSFLGDSSQQTFLDTINRDVRMGQAMTQVINGFWSATPNAAPIRLINHFNDGGTPYGIFGDWGALEKFDPPYDSAKYNALMALLGHGKHKLNLKARV